VNPGSPAFEARSSVAPSVFRDALGSVCTPVAVVTSFLDGRPHGTTVGTFSTLSMAPPLVLVALDVASELPSLLRDAGAYAVNVLADGQQDLARAFAHGGPEVFDRVPWTLEQGMPRLDGAASWVRCRLEDLLPGGDHLIAIGHVVHAEARDVEPLLYRSSSFGTLASLPAS
jgi:flavin reductase (DIM6/NTAB) family NADH-FMN oxidoreductase RutF